MVAALALLFAVALTATQATAAGAAPAAPTKAGGQAGSTLPVHLPAAQPHPNRVSAGPAGLISRNDCATVRSRLPQFARTGQRHVSCTTTRSAPPAKSAAPAPHAKSAAPAPHVVSPAQVWCDTLGANTWWLTRTSMCITGILITYEVFDAQTGAVLGTANFDVSQSMQLETTSLVWEERDYITMLDATGLAIGVEVGFTATCASLCTAASDLSVPVPIAVGETLPALITYTDAPASGQDTTSATYTMEAIQPGTIPVQPIVSWPGPTDYPIRCDTLVGGSPGCVIPAVTPTFFVSVAQSGASAIMIAFSQQYLPDGWGSSQPLRRLASDALANTNRNIICGVFTPDPTVPGGDSCDEFPFAKTYESGAMLGLTGADCAEIKPYIDDVTGTWVVQLVNNVTFTERCTRGHVTLADNSDVGGDLGRFTQQERLLDFDPYWLTVTN
jgi:hypothetical protein